MYLITPGQQTQDAEVAGSSQTKTTQSASGTPRRVALQCQCSEPKNTDTRYDTCHRVPQLAVGGRQGHPSRLRRTRRLRHRTPVVYLPDTQTTQRTHMRNRSLTDLGTRRRRRILKTLERLDQDTANVP